MLGNISPSLDVKIIIGARHGSHVASLSPIALAAAAAQKLLLFVHVGIRGGQHLLKELHLLFATFVKQLLVVLHAGQLCNDLVGVALIDQEPLPLPREGHLARVLADEGVEEGVELLGDGALFGSKDSTESLSLLSSGSSVRRDLD